MDRQSSLIHLLLLILLATFFASCQQNGDDGTSKIRPDVDSMINIYNRKLNEGKAKQAIKFLDSSYLKLKNLSNLDRWKIYLNKNNHYLGYEYNVAKAELYTDSLELMLSKLSKKRTTNYVKTVFARGNVLLAQKKYNQAFKNYYDGRQYALQHLDQCMLSTFTDKLAMIKLKQEKYNESIIYFKQALKESRSCATEKNFSYQFAYVQAKMNAIAMVYETMKKTDSAIAYYQKTIDFILKAKPKNKKQSIFVQRALGVVYGNLGGIYKEQGNYNKAEDLLLLSIAINDRPGYEVQDAMTAKIKLASLYLKTKRENLAYQLLQGMLKDMANTQGNYAQQNGVRLSLYQLLMIYYGQIGNLKEAYQAQTNYHKIKDTIENINYGLKFADMNMVFELNAQKYKAAILEEEGKLKTAYLIVFGILVFAAAFFLWFFWRDMKKSRSYIEKLKRLNLQNQQTLGALEQSQAAHDNVLRIVAHDLRNPLSGITGVVSLMLEEDGFSEETREELALIKATGENSLGLVNELLQSSFNSKDLKMEEVEMGELVQYCAELLRHKAAEKNQQIIYFSFPINVLGDREKIWRVISNLIGNATKFSPKDSVIKVSMEKDMDKVIVAITDEGIGIPTAMAEKLFDMFTPAKRNGTEGEQSFGMGLSICKQIVEAHGGQIWFESQVGRGTTFYFSLPIKAKEQA